MKEILILISFIGMFGCGLSSQNQVNPGFFAEGFEIPYTLNAPTQKMKLDRELVEISGLTYSQKTKSLLAVNDEDAFVFVLDPYSGKILDKYDFGKADDYEGIASHDNYIYITESNGNIKVVNESTGEKTTEYDDLLSRDNDVEGLCFNPVNKKLLMAAKGDSEADGNDKDVKAVFSMEIATGKIDEKPYLYQNLSKAMKTLQPKYISSNAIVNLSVSSRVDKYGPSAIAVQPGTDLIYMLSSSGKLLTVSDQYGDIKAIVFLKNAVHIQPEGITFAPDGTLFISNEGRSGKGVIYRYEPIEKE